MSTTADAAAGPVLTEQQRTFFAAYGYLHLPGWWADGIEELTDAFDTVFGDEGNERLELAMVGRRFEPWVVIAHFVERHPRLATLAHDERLVGVAEALLGPGARYEGSEGNVFRCTTDWHYDSPTSLPDHRHLKIALYLDPVDHDTGALRVLPASHHDAALYRGPLQPCLGFDGQSAARLGVAAEDLPSWTVPSVPGDLLVWDFRLMHAAYGTTGRRRQFALNFVGAAPAGAPVPVGPPGGY